MKSIILLLSSALVFIFLIGQLRSLPLTNENEQLIGYWRVADGGQEATIEFKADGTFQYTPLLELVLDRDVVMGTYQRLGSQLLLRSDVRRASGPCYFIFGEYEIEAVTHSEILLDVVENECPSLFEVPTNTLARSLERR